ncbi:MAG: hypothetical protein JNL82_08795 [Myxococcales bacterium]|nr:hypothetical protein [Myxococcales bacterium]
MMTQEIEIDVEASDDEPVNTGRAARFRFPDGAMVEIHMPRSHEVARVEFNNKSEPWFVLKLPDGSGNDGPLRLLGRAN